MATTRHEARFATRAGSTRRRRRPPTTRIDPQYGLFIGGEFVAPRKRATSTRSTRRREKKPLAEVAQADAGDVDRAVAAARRAYGGAGRSSSRRARQVHLPHRARHPGTGARVRGDRIDGRRQADQGVARRRRPARRRALLLLRRLGGQARLRIPGAAARPLGVAGQIIPWNFPLLMAAWKIAPGARLRQHGRAQARGDHAAHRAQARRDDPRRRICRPASSTSSPAPGETGAALVDHPDVDKIAFTGSTEVGKPIQRRLAGTAKHSRSSSAARRRTSSSTTRRSTRRSKASSMASTSTRGTSAAPARGCWCRKPSLRK